MVGEKAELRSSHIALSPHQSQMANAITPTCFAFLLTREAPKKLGLFVSVKETNKRGVYSDSAFGRSLSSSR
jgi:hypothetical protein